MRGPEWMNPTDTDYLLSGPVFMEVISESRQSWQIRILKG